MATKKITPRIFKGTRDFLPEEMLPREKILEVMKNTFRKYGFDPLETPAFEFVEVLSGKYGEEGEKLIYKLAYKGGNELALRYDLTVPLARVVAMYPDLVLPFKRYQIQPVWRADNPQLRQGRFREFYQCDVDTIGSASMLADAEIIAIIAEVLGRLGFQQFKIRINNRKILAGLVLFAGVDIKREAEVCRAIDKLGKIGLEGVKSELKEAGIAEKSIAKILDFCSISGDNATVLQEAQKRLASIPVAQEGLTELQELFGHLSALAVAESNITLDLSLARGLDYYTGPIFEAVVPDLPHLGSVAGGGRYDNLIGLFTGKDLPATGTTVGLDRIFTALQQLERLDKSKSATQVLVCLFDTETQKRALEITQNLRKAGLAAETYLAPDKLKKQLTYADRKKIPIVVIAGPEEMKNNTVTIRNMRTSEQTNISGTKLVSYLQEHLQ